MWFKRKPKQNNRTEAVELIQSEVNKRRSLDYEELLKWVESDKKEHYEQEGKSGIIYQFELFAFYDDEKTKDIRLVGNIDGGDISAYRPLSYVFIKSPDNKFVGE